jgi:hypothetical protein
MVAEIGKRLPPGGLELEAAFRELVPAKARLALEAAEQGWIDAGKPIHQSQLRYTRSEWLQRESIRAERVLHPSYLRAKDAYEACKSQLRDQLGRGEAIAAGCLGSLTGTVWAVEPGDWRDGKFKILAVKYGSDGHNRIIWPDKQQLWQVRVYQNVSVADLTLEAPGQSRAAKSNTLKKRVMTAFTAMANTGQLEPTAGGQARAIRELQTRLKLPDHMYATIKTYIAPSWEASLQHSEAHRRRK